jgi:hypothetical protein
MDKNEENFLPMTIGPLHKDLPMNDYLVMILDNEAAQARVTPAEMQKLIAGHAEFGKGLRASGIYRDGATVDNSSLHANLFALAFVGAGLVSVTEGCRAKNSLVSTDQTRWR